MSMFNPIEFEEIMPLLRKAGPGIVSAADDVIPSALNSIRKPKDDNQKPLAKPMLKAAHNFADGEGNVYDTDQVTLGHALKHLGKNTAIGTGVGAIGGAGLGALLASLTGQKLSQGAAIGGSAGALGGSVLGAASGTYNPLTPIGKIDYKQALQHMEHRKQAGVTGAALGGMVGTAIAPMTGALGGVAGGLGGAIAGGGMGTITGAITAALKSMKRNPQVLDRVGGHFRPTETAEEIIKRHIAKGTSIGAGTGVVGGTLGGAGYPIYAAGKAGSGLEDMGRAHKNEEKK